MPQVMKFGVRNILAGKDIVFQHKSTAHDYYKQLLAIRIEGIHRFRKIRAKYAPELVGSEMVLEKVLDDIGDIYDGIKQRRQKASVKKDGKIKPTKLPATDEETAKLETLTAQKKQLLETIKKERKLFNDLLEEADTTYKARTNKTTVQLIRQCNDLSSQISKAKAKKKDKDEELIASLKKQLSETMKERDKDSPKTNAKKVVNADVLHAMLQEDWPEAWKEIAKSKFDTDIACRDYPHEGLTHGTYESTGKAVKQAIKDSKTDPDPEKVFWKGGRKIGSQITKKGRKTLLTGAVAYAGTDARFRLTDVTEPRGRKDPTKRTERTPGSSSSHVRYAVAHFMLGKDIEISCEVRLHRPIPKDAQITWVYLVPEQRGSRTNFSLQLTVNTDRPLVERASGEGDCMLRLGWSRAEPVSAEETYRGLVVAHGHSDKGLAERIVLPGRIYETIEMAKAIKGAADVTFKDKEGLGASQQYSKNRHLLPDWAPDKVSSRGQLAKFTRTWLKELCTQADDKDNFHRILPGDVDRKDLFKHHWRKSRGIEPRKRGRTPSLDSFVANRDFFNKWLASHGVTDPKVQFAVWLEWWRIKDEHMWSMNTNLDKKARRHRKDFYRNVAAQLSMKYGTIGVLELDLPAVVKRKTPDKDQNEMHKLARYQRGVAGCYELVDALTQAFGKERFRRVKRDSFPEEQAA